MEHKNLDGQLNIFDIVSGEKQEERKATEERDFFVIHRSAGEMHVVMHKIFEDMLEKEKIVVAYVDYNIVYYKARGEGPKALQFKNAKLAVDYYMKLLEELKSEDMLLLDDGEVVLLDV